MSIGGRPSSPLTRLSCLVGKSKGNLSEEFLRKHSDRRWPEAFAVVVSSQAIATPSCWPVNPTPSAWQQGYGEHERDVAAHARDGEGVIFIPDAHSICVTADHCLKEIFPCRVDRVGAGVLSRFAPKPTNSMSMCRHFEFPTVQVERALLAISYTSEACVFWGVAPWCDAIVRSRDLREGRQGGWWRRRRITTSVPGRSALIWGSENASGSKTFAFIQ